MRYIYNCVKLVLLIACLGFAGQSSATKSHKLDYVEIEGLQFKCQGDKLMFRFANDVQQYAKDVYQGNGFHETVNGNIFLNAINNEAVFKNIEAGILKPELESCPLINWMVQCDGGHEADPFDEEELATKDNVFAPGILCQNFISELISQCGGKSDDTLKWEADNYHFLLNKKTSSFEVEIGSGSDKMPLVRYLQRCNLQATCDCRHGKNDLTDEDYPAYTFPDLTNMIRALIPLVKALTSDQKEEREEEDEEGFGGFGDLF